MLRSSVSCVCLYPYYYHDEITHSIISILMTLYTVLPEIFKCDKSQKSASFEDNAFGKSAYGNV